MPIRWSSILNGSWETTLSLILVRRPLGMVGGSVSVSRPVVYPPPLAVFCYVLRIRLGRGVGRGDSDRKRPSFILLQTTERTNPLLFFV